MPNLATWIRACDEKYFARFFTPDEEVRIWNAARAEVPLEQMHGLLLTGGADVAPQYLHQDIPNPAVIEKGNDPKRDAWEFAAVQHVLAHELPILAICKGVQLLNVALGGTLHLDIAGHNLPEQKNNDVQPLRWDRGARHQYAKVNSSHHQAIDRLGDGLVIEAWCADDDVVEQVKLREYGFAVGVQYHPERGHIYRALFDDFVQEVTCCATRRS